MWTPFYCEVAVVTATLGHPLRLGTWLCFLGTGALLAKAGSPAWRQLRPLPPSPSSAPLNSSCRVRWMNALKVVAPFVFMASDVTHLQLTPLSWGRGLWGQPGWGHLLGTAIRPPSAPSKTLSYGDAGRAVFSTRGIQAPCPGSVWFGPFSARHVLHVALCDSFVLNGDSRWRVN